MIDQNVAIIAVIVFMITIIIFALKGGFDRLLHTLGSRKEEPGYCGIEIHHSAMADNHALFNTQYKIGGPSLQECFQTYINLKELEKIENDTKSKTK